MPWVRFDDMFTENAKIEALSDATFRLHVSAIFDCAKKLSDGRVSKVTHKRLTSASKNRHRLTQALVREGLWHEAGSNVPQCPSKHCPPPGPDGWVIHDYLAYQPSKAQVLAQREADAKRQQRWRENRGHGVTKGSTEEYNGERNGVSSSAPTRPKRTSGTGSGLPQGGRAENAPPAPSTDVVVPRSPKSNGRHSTTNDRVAQGMDLARYYEERGM